MSLKYYLTPILSLVLFVNPLISNDESLTSIEFVPTESEIVFTLNSNITKIWVEAYGGRGGSKSNQGYGAKVSAVFDLNKFPNDWDSNLYINTGGNSQGNNGGYNGGGNGRIAVPGGGNSTTYGAGGGGATHIAISSGLLYTFSDNQLDVLIAAGGGGGAFGTYTSTGTGHAGKAGQNGSRGFFDDNQGIGASQSSGGYTNDNLSWWDTVNGSFGLGGYIQNETLGYPYSRASSGGGGGWYGGGAGAKLCSGGGGSSNVNLNFTEDGSEPEYVTGGSTLGKVVISWLSSEYELPDTDGDGLNDYDDTDDDGDGVEDDLDAFPLDGSETVDADNDDIGDNQDTDDDNDGLSDLLEEQIGTNKSQSNNILSIANLLINSQASYNTVVIERDARPTQTSYDAVVAERDARPTQSSYDAMVAERDARPIQSSYDAVVADRDAKIQQFSALDSRVNEILPKSVPDPPVISLEAFNQLFDEGKQMIEESKSYSHDDYYYIDYKIDKVEGFISNGTIESIDNELDDIIDELEFSPLVLETPYDFYEAKQKFESAKTEFNNQMAIQNAYDPTPVTTATLEEYIASLNSDIISAREERDNKLSMEEVRDMKLKSRMMQVDGGSASLNITLEATDNLSITSPEWAPVPETKVVIHQNFQNGKIQIDVEGDDSENTGVKFYRFKMDD